MLRSPGVAVRTHLREPDQLMIAEDEGHVHFIDMRFKSARPSLSRSLPPSFSLDAGGLRDADWSPYDPYLVGGICGSQYVGWDLRHEGLMVGDAEPNGAIAFRWGPHSAQVATSSNEVQVHKIRFTAGHSEWQMSKTHVLSQDLPTRVASISWMHVSDQERLCASFDTKVCIWDIQGIAPGAIM